MLKCELEFWRRVNIGEYSPRQSRGECSPIFTSPSANNCFSIITQVIIREKQVPSEKCRFFCLFQIVTRQ